MKQYHHHIICPSNDHMLTKAIAFVSAILIDVFQEETILSGDLCVVYNDPKGKGPVLMTQPPLSIRLCIDNPYDVCTLIGQLVHELVHYIFHQRKQDKNKLARRYEEIVAEAVTLYVLKIAGSYYPLSSIDFEVVQADNFELYFQQKHAYYERNKWPITKPVSESRWRLLEMRSTHFRERHYQEVLRLFDQLHQPDFMAKSILDYTPYLRANGSLDLVAWQQDDTSQTIAFLRHLQPIIKE